MAALPTQSSFPLPTLPPKTITQSGFRISTLKLPILNSSEIDAMTERLTIAPPEMIFGKNYVEIEHIASGWAIRFDAESALDTVGKDGERMLKVSYSEEWSKMRSSMTSSIKEIVKPFDWSYTPTNYAGTVTTPPPASTTTESSTSFEFKQTDKPLPLHLLSAPDPILFFDEVHHYEDELADNGIALLSTKIRVMPQRLLLLCRFFLRLDGVIVRVNDVRVYVEFGEEKVVREVVEREESYKDVVEKLRRRGVMGDDLPSVLRDAHAVAEVMGEGKVRREELILKGVKKPE
ncbi:TIP41-domain-containing protein [Ascobolus immersus RN42]|uniref:TIP41-domain-containing protein n=1 Tax=Ascobolus immersus RN42 TaxID=1160509 RepID=A0A3N4IGU5_ASCIM|nr:TIP41-domain-containing protein [Ascobolus immersus RN42]